jgi:hypothetical protein
MTGPTSGQGPVQPEVGVLTTDAAPTTATTGVPSHDHGPAVPCDCEKTCGEGWPFIIGVALLVMGIERIWSRRRKARAARSSPPAPADGTKKEGRHEAD